MNTAKGNFHINQLKMRESAIVLASLSWADVKKPSEDSMVRYTVESHVVGD